MTEERKGPRRFSAPELKKVGVTILERQRNIALLCDNCGAAWSPDLQAGGKLPRGYWKCPNGCNDPDRPR